MEEFTLNSEYIELIRLIKLLGLTETGGQAKIMIGQGTVLLNGQTEMRKRVKLRPGDEIDVAGRKIRITSPRNQSG